MQKKWGFVVVTLITLFLAIGYYLSDDYFFVKLISEQQFKTPKDAFAYINKNTSPVQPLHITKAVQGLTPRYLLEKQKYLWCNEGAILLIAIVHQMGYPVRLIDLVDETGISRHTIAEVYEGNRWVTYDYTHSKIGASYRECAGFYKPTPRINPYRNIYNTITGNNFLLMKMALFVRNVPEQEVPGFIKDKTNHQEHYLVKNKGN